jgi:hypothetical protein
MFHANPGGAPVVNIQENYPSAVGNVPYGPAVFLTGLVVNGKMTTDAIDNQGGQVAITNAFGSVATLATINAGQLNITAQHGTVLLTGASQFLGPDPYSGFESAMIWPGGDPHTQFLGPNAARDAVAWAANAEFNATGQYGTDPTNNTDNTNFTADLIGFKNKNAGVTSNTDNSYEYYSADLPQASDNGNDTSNSAATYSPVGQTYAMPGAGGSNGYFPMVPVEPLSTTANYPTPPTPETIQGTVTSGSNWVTNLNTTAGLAVGETLAGTGIANGTTIRSINQLSVGGILTKGMNSVTLISPLPV